MDYYLSFQYTVEDGQVINSQINYAKCMHSSNKKVIKYIKYFNQHNNIKDIFKYESENIIDLLSKNGIILHSDSKVTNFYLNDKIKITYLPQRFDIIFKDGYMMFGLKE